MEFEPEKETETLTSAFALLIIKGDTKIVREILFSLVIDDIFGVCKSFEKDPNKAVRDFCDPQFWASILLPETNKTPFQIGQYFETNHTLEEIKDYYNENFSLNSYFKKTYKFYIALLGLKDGAISTSVGLRDKPEILELAFDQNQRISRNTIFEKEGDILLSRNGISEAKLKENKDLIFKIENKIPIVYLEGFTHIVRHIKNITLDFSTVKRIVFFATESKFIKKDKDNFEYVNLKNIIILTDTGPIKFLLAEKEVTAKVALLPTNFILATNQKYNKGKFDYIHIKSKLFGTQKILKENTKIEILHSLYDLKFDSFRIPNRSTLVENWEYFKDDIQKQRIKHWNELQQVHIPKPKKISSLLLNDFEIKYILGKSIVDSKTETFAIVLSKTSQKASIWNCNSNEFYCNHKHNLEDLKNWIEFEKEKNDDICPNCCN